MRLVGKSYKELDPPISIKKIAVMPSPTAGRQFRIYWKFLLRCGFLKEYCRKRGNKNQGLIIREAVSAWFFVNANGRKSFPSATYHGKTGIKLIIVVKSCG